MIIRQATEEDIPKVKRIIDSLQIQRSEILSDEEEHHGFLDYTKSEEELLLALNPYFAVAESSGRIRGYLLAYNNSFFRTKFGDAISRNWRHILDNATGSFVYFDQFGVSNPVDLGAGRTVCRILHHGLKKAREDGLEKAIAYVRNWPAFNRKASTLLEHLGFESFDEIELPNGIELKVYELYLKKENSGEEILRELLGS